MTQSNVDVIDERTMSFTLWKALHCARPHVANSRSAAAALMLLPGRLPVWHVTTRGSHADCSFLQDSQKPVQLVRGNQLYAVKVMTSAAVLGFACSDT